MEITAAQGGKPPKVRGVAYSGGKMRLFGWSRPVVVDLGGLTIPENVPLLADHENMTLARVGLVRPAVTERGLEIEGEIVATGELADAIVAQGRAGADWQLSVGAEVETAELVETGKRTVNGLEHDAPFYHVTKATLREVSVVEMRRRKCAAFSEGRSPKAIAKRRASARVGADGQAMSSSLVMEVAIPCSEATGTSLLQCFAAGVGLVSAEVRPRGADGTVIGNKDGGATEEMATNQLDTYAKKFCLTRKMIIPDILARVP